jgi:hypothetical protein
MEAEQEDDEEKAVDKIGCAICFAEWEGVVKRGNWGSLRREKGGAGAKVTEGEETAVIAAARQASEEPARAAF